MPRRIGRSILNLLTALSLLLCVATTVLWVRSYWWPDTLHWDRAGRHYQIMTDDGGILFAQHPYSREWSPRGLNTRSKSDYRAPLWALLILWAALPAIRGTRYRRRIAQRRRGYCPACGYDLRATPDRCPECGTIPTPCGASGGTSSTG